MESRTVGYIKMWERKETFYDCCLTSKIIQKVL